MRISVPNGTKPTLGILPWHANSWENSFNGKVRTKIEDEKHCSDEEYVHNVNIKRIVYYLE